MRENFEKFQNMWPIIMNTIIYHPVVQPAPTGATLTEILNPEQQMLIIELYLCVKRIRLPLLFIFITQESEEGKILMGLAPKLHQQ